MRKVFLPLSECICAIEVALKPYVGIVSEIADHRPLLESILDNYLYPPTLKPYNTLEHLTALRLPSDIARDVLARIERDLIRMIQMSFQIIYPSRTYLYEIMDETVVIVEELNECLVLITPPANVLADEEDGYTPERLRNR